jgi:hypothetical protein
LLCIAAAATALLAACAGTPGVTEKGEVRVSAVSAADSIALPIGRTVRVDGLAALTLRDVPAESRCPVDVQCVHAGDATIELDVCPSGCATAVRVRLGLVMEPRSTIIDGVRIETMRLVPLPRAGALIRREDYIATVRVTRASR